MTANNKQKRKSAVTQQRPFKKARPGRQHGALTNEVATTRVDKLNAGFVAGQKQNSPCCVNLKNMHKGRISNRKSGSTVLGETKATAPTNAESEQNKTHLPSSANSQLVWIATTAKGNTTHHPALLLERTQEQVHIKWTINDEKTWLDLAEIELIDGDMPKRRSCKAASFRNRASTVPVTNQTSTLQNTRETEAFTRGTKPSNNVAAAAVHGTEVNGEASSHSEPHAAGSDSECLSHVESIGLGSAFECVETAALHTPTSLVEWVEWLEKAILPPTEKRCGRENEPISQAKVRHQGSAVEFVEIAVTPPKKKPRRPTSAQTDYQLTEEFAQLAVTGNMDVSMGSDARSASDREVAMTSTASKHHHEIALGTLVEKHFPGEGWYIGKVVDMKVSTDSKEQVYNVSYAGKSDSEELSRVDLLDILLPPNRFPVCKLPDFKECWEKLKPESYEVSQTIRQANSKISDHDAVTTDQKDAQYGRLLPDATNKIFKVLGLKRSDTFFDIGHGIGNMTFQAGYCVGCKSRGIELVGDRFNVSQKLAMDLDEEICAKTGVPGPIIDLRNGDLTDPAQHNFIVTANKLVVNNYGGVFSTRMQTKGNTSGYHLDHYIGGLFASLQEGSMLVTLYDLQLGPTQSEVDEWRKHHKMKPDPRGSFFELVKVDIGPEKDAFSWSNSEKPAILYVYKRVKQDPNTRGTTLMCTNIGCTHSTDGSAFPAVSLTNQGIPIVGVCGCKTSLKPNRNGKPVPFKDSIQDYFLSNKSTKE